MVTFDDFQQLDIRVGIVTQAEPFPEAKKPAYRLTIDFGPDVGVKRSSARLTERYTASELVGRRVLGVVNFPSLQIGPFESEVLTLGVPDQNGDCVLIVPDKADAVGGGKVF